MSPISVGLADGADVAPTETLGGIEVELVGAIEGELVGAIEEGESVGAIEGESVARSGQSSGKMGKKVNLVDEAMCNVKSRRKCPRGAGDSSSEARAHFRTS